MLMLTLSIVAQDKTSTILPGKGRIDVEKLNKDINLNQDISKLSVSELRVLRNAFAARQGFCLMDADLRHIYNQTTWYNRLMWMRSEQWDPENNVEVPEMAPVDFTPAEQAFIDKLAKREDELLLQNYKAGKGNIVNIGNIVNPYQLESIDPRLSAALGRQGFAIVPNNYPQLFQVYEKNDYYDFPSFVTTDLFLQVYHLYFDCLLRKVEQEKLSPVMEDFAQKMYQEMMAKAKTETDADMVDAALRNATFFAVASGLITGLPTPALPGKWMEMANKELKSINSYHDNFSEYLGYEMAPFGYSLFRPRGHYTRTKELERYFRAMMWMQTAPFGTDSGDQLKAALLMAESIGTNKTLKKAYLSVFDPITYLMGVPDNITILQVYDEMQRQHITAAQAIADPLKLGSLAEAIDRIGDEQTRIRPKFERSSHNKINLMPQRYQPDAEVLQEMVDYDNETTLRDVPKGLDIFAAMGSSAAERILIDELNESKKWKDYTPMLNKMKKRMGEIDWDACVSNKWVDAIYTNTQAPAGAPYFMLTPQWDKKSLNASLASWAELKHDAILYAKQPMGAECGAGGPPEPVVKGYVEPNVAFWTKAIALIDATKDVLSEYGLLTEEADDLSDQVKEEAEFLLEISKKELAGEPVSEVEYSQIETIGASFENLSLALVKDKDQELMNWNDVQGADKFMALVADVYTANADNNPQKSILYEAVGRADEIYVVVEIDGYLYLTRGAVFSYREFREDIGALRLTDEDWQQLLKKQPRKGVPSWMNEIIVPLDNLPQENDEVFYSTGC